MEKVNFGTVAKSYARSRNDIPNTLFESLQLRNVSFEGKKVADIGCGSGTLTRKLMFRKADVIGIDPSEELLNEAIAINKDNYLNVPYKKGTAEATGLGEGEYDIVTVMRAWHWFDREAALKEINRILKKRGTLIVADSGFTSGHPVVESTFAVIKKYLKDGLKPPGSKGQSNQRINGFPVEWFEEWRLNSFELRDFYKFDYTVTFSNEQWIDRVESVSWLAGMNDSERQAALLELSGTIEKQYGEEATHAIGHSCYICILRKQG
ncbi:class I SAM-dependent methyltransferase [Bacillus sp. V3-13]|uniref:class I SAM-dependent methyltransferase n=1 Tax=Bacillus sp. V3-13 TaxID=2053728 RepID=UPI000C757DE0|nr:class I SAM-dependent methyltransferase [Bacillus sp. V3-13]PLR75675.1 class I SAM-dependent methyltransferase [Bacillus sp. V3-13]